MLPTVTNIPRCALISGLGKVPDSYQRQNRGKNHEQANRSPLGIWMLHILLLEVGGRERVEPPEIAFYSRSCVAMALLLLGRVLNYQSSFFRVNQIIPRHNNSQAIHPIPRFLQPFDCHYPKRGTISKSLENVEFRTHFEPPA
jgi:hypothetical protein